MLILFTDTRMKTFGFLKLVNTFQTCAAHFNSLLIPHILLIVNGMQYSTGPVLLLSQQDVIAVYQLLGVGFLLHQLVCLPSDEMKPSPRREPNTIASCLVSFHGTPVAAFATSNNRLRIHNRGSMSLRFGLLQVCHVANALFQALTLES